MLKAQADIVSAVIIVLIALSLTSTALLWGLPLIQKRQDSAMVTRVSNLLSRELPSKIAYVANVGGSDSLTVDANGVWSLNESKNMLTFTFFSKVSDKAVGLWIGGDACGDDGFNETQSGVLGVDEPCVVCVRADQLSSGYNIVYQIGCRELKTETKTYKIELKPLTGVSTSTSKTIRISRGEVRTEGNLIKTEVYILL
jgi:Uri superfamily endonuclease